MEVFAPLIDAAAWWLTLDANLRLFWNAVGAVFLLIATTVAISGAVWLWRNPPIPEGSKRKSSQAKSGDA